MNTLPPQITERCGFVPIIGAPNVGKSTLINAFCGQKISIVTHKAQTTRGPIRGICKSGHTQIVFVDTPGFFKPTYKNPLEGAMLRSAYRSVKEGNALLFVLNAVNFLRPEEERLLRRVVAHKLFYVIINKIDLIPKHKLLAHIQQLQEFKPKDIFMTKATHADGTSPILKALENDLPISPWLYPSHAQRDSSLEAWSAEITREKLLLFLHEEMPYTLHVETESVLSMRSGEIKIHQVIYIVRPSHRKIILGKDGATIRRIRLEAAHALSQLLAKKVHLFIFIKNDKKWSTRQNNLSALGLHA